MDIGTALWANAAQEGLYFLSLHSDEREYWFVHFVDAYTHLCEV